MSEVLEDRVSPMRLRAMLEDMLRKELLGPAGGEEEELTEPRVSWRYLTGVISPSGEGAPAAPAGAEEEDQDIVVLQDQLAEGGVDTGDEGTTDLDVPIAPFYKPPSSFGLTFCVGEHARGLKVSARWGHYCREDREGRQDGVKRVWKRYPRSGSVEIPLKDGIVKQVAPVAAFPEVYIKGRVRKREGHFIVTLFLVNGQDEGRPKDESYLFQPELTVEAPDGTPIFEKKAPVRRESKVDPATRLEERELEMLYRRHLEFAVGHGVSVHAEVPPEWPERATHVNTTFIPSQEVWMTTPPTTNDAERNPAFARLDGLVLDMKELAETPAAKLRSKLHPLLDAYAAWIDGEAGKLGDPAEGLAAYRDVAQIALDECRQTLGRIEAGLELLEEDGQAEEAFAFMNRAMWLQRTRGTFSQQVRRGEKPDFDRDIDLPGNRSWYPFQIAFILLNLPAVTRLDHPDRSEKQDALADLLFFPTGGGKTEAYLGLAAYTMGLRRLQGTVAGRPGEHGVAVLMRYTLRLLTIQQFQRASALMCACEVIRREALEAGDKRWGETPFRIGLWVGRKTTPNRTEHSIEAIKQSRGERFMTGGLGTPYQLTNCPWCGSPIEPGKHLVGKTYEQGPGRTFIYCGDQYGLCPFSRRKAPDEGLPVLVVDEEIYRRLPALLIATVDKFAQMPWNGAVQMLFGQVNGYCTRHGFRSPDIHDADSHQRTRSGMPRAATQPCGPLRPPDLIIQDELHLISGPLGTLVGLYETALDKLCTWEVSGRKVRPKVLASTATIRSAASQVHSLFLRKVAVFPANGLDARDNFFSIQRPPSEDHPGRQYIGICAPGHRLKAALIRVYVGLLCAAQSLSERYGKSADPWMTLVGYFNSMRELGGMRRLVDDDVRSRTWKMDRRGLGKRSLSVSSRDNYLEELTSRMRSEDIPKILDRLEAVFDPDLDALRVEMAKKKQYDRMPKKPIDVLLATNMVSVGVDVQRLGLMAVAGQPKSTAEYIQATSRVGRRFPGLVCTVFNWARPRDISHYESFEHYHATFYKHVEALSVTPFSAGALQRGLAALLVSLVRMSGPDFNPNDAAGRATRDHPYFADAIETIVRRAGLVGSEPGVGDDARAELQSKLDIWLAEAQAGGRTLTYDFPYGPGAGPKRQTAVPLLQRPKIGDWDDFTCLNSLREVEPTVNLIIEDGGMDASPEGATAGSPRSDNEGEGER